MELLQLTYFCDAAKSEKLSATARKFLVPTSNISQSIKRLEKELGTELFEHRPNKVVLNQAGKRFFEKAEAALSLLKEAAAEITDRDEEIGGEIQLLVSCNRRFVTNAIEACKAQYPKISFLLRHEAQEGFTPDIVVTDRCPLGYTAYRLLAEEDILLALSEKHPLAQKKELQLPDFRNDGFISMPKGRSLFRLSETLCREAGFVPNITIQTDDPFYIRKYVSLGLGVALIPAFSWEGLFPENVVLRKIGAYTRKTHICVPLGRKMKKAVAVFLQYLER